MASGDNIAWINSLANKILEYQPSHLNNFVAPEELERELEEMLVSKKNAFKTSISNSNGIEKNNEKVTGELSETIQLVLEKCVNTSHPMFLSQMYGGVNPIGMIAAFIIEKMNTNQHTYEAAPVFVLAEKIVLKHLRKMFYGSHDGDGIFAPGGSIANMYGISLARNEMFPQVKLSGLSVLPPLVVFCSEEAHYSIGKMGNLMGIGLNNVMKIKTAKNGSMIVSDLKNTISQCRNEGRKPFVVVATAGTTVLGAFDPINDIADVCKKENLWLHCDASWGGAFIFSEKLRNQWLTGIERCDSICWNAHKMLGAPFQCSAFITRHTDALTKCNTIPAPYLFQTDKHYSSVYDDAGAKTIQCGRKSDAFKLWLMWTVMGLDGFCAAIENAEDCARYFTERIKEREGFELYLESHQCTNMYFWFVPPDLRNQEKTDDWWRKISDVTCKIKTVLLLSNQLMITYSPIPHKDIPNAFRLVLSACPRKTYQDMEKVIQLIENVGSTVLNTGTVG